MSLINAVMNMPHHSITPSDANELRYANDAETKIRKIKLEVSYVSASINESAWGSAKGSFPSLYCPQVEPAHV
jgi:hypothetical protein